MPTNDERREVADGLRRQVKRLGPQMDAHEFAHYGADVIDSDNEILRWDQMMLRLADLIEPEERTCRVIMKWDGLDGRDPVCSECGTYFDDKKWHEQKFCPSCGAKVVEQ